MKFFAYSAATLLALIPATQAQGGFYEVCESSTFEYNVIVTGTYWTGFVITPWLSGDCLGPSGTYTNTTLDLNTCLENNDGSLQWKKDGNFDASCQCDIDSLPNLCCTCEKNNNAEVPDVCMNLDQQVAVVNGQLACPDVPS